MLAPEQSSWSAAMAVVVKLGGNDPKKGPMPKSAGAATKASTTGAGFRLPIGEGDEWFHDGRILGAIASGIVIAGIAGGLMATQSPQRPLAGVKPSAPQTMPTEEQINASIAAKARPTLPGGYDADPDNATTPPKIDPRAAAADPTPDD